MESEGPEVLRQINKRVPLSDSRCAQKLTKTLSVTTKDGKERKNAA